ncbi:MAG: hypothetical protein KGO49_06940 [Gammaproteobacteria bacterium]|nr:hypothetical protein [Gammaproteobacteria bacterium]
MRKLALIYLVFYVVMVFLDVFSPAAGQPILFTFFNFIIGIASAICVKAYIDKNRSDKYLAIFKAMPVLLILSTFVELYYVYLELSSNTSNSSTVVVSADSLNAAMVLMSLFVLILNLPALYMCFKLGYSEEFGTSISTQKIDIDSTAKNELWNKVWSNWKIYGGVIALIAISLMRYGHLGSSSSATESQPVIDNSVSDSKQLTASNSENQNDTKQESETNKMTDAAQDVASKLNDIKSQAADEIASAAPDIQSTNTEVNSEVNKYNIMKRNGASLAELCIQASTIKNILLNLGDESGYHAWNKAAATNCNLADTNPGM